MVYPCKLKFYCIKVGYKGVHIGRTCLCDDKKARNTDVRNHIVLSLKQNQKMLISCAVTDGTGQLHI